MKPRGSQSLQNVRVIGPKPPRVIRYPCGNTSSKFWYVSHQPLRVVFDPTIHLINSLVTGQQLIRTIQLVVLLDFLIKQVLRIIFERFKCGKRFFFRSVRSSYVVPEVSFTFCSQFYLTLQRKVSSISFSFHRATGF